MTEQALQEFSSKILKAKNLYETKKLQCENLKREAIKYEKEYQEIVQQRKKAELLEKELRQQLESEQGQSIADNQKQQKELEDLAYLRNQKQSLSREKNLFEQEVLKNTLQLEELVQERIKLQNQAKFHSEKLGNIATERQALQEEHIRTNEAIENYSLRIKDLKNEMSTMKGLITQSNGTLSNNQSYYQSSQQ